MRIAVWHNLPSGGGKRALHDHVRGLALRGHHLESWSPPTADQSYMPLTPHAVEHVVPFDWREPGTHPSRLGRRLAPYRDVAAMVEAMDRHASACAEAIAAGGFDLIYAGACRNFATPFLARHSKLPSALYLGEPFRRFYEAEARGAGMPRLPWVPDAITPRPRSPRLWPRWYGDRLQDLAEAYGLRLQAHQEAVNAQAFDRLLCNSRFSQESMKRAYGIASKVCYLGIDAEAFPVSDAPKERYAVGLGSFGANKGIDVAIRAIGSIEAETRPDLVWIGNFSDPWYLEDIKKLAEGLGVKLVPRMLVPQGELVDLLGRAAVMLYTSRLEPFGYAPLEANACGTAVVGVAEGGVRESIEPGVNGRLVDPDDVEALGASIAHYVADLARAREEGLRARRHVVEHWGLDASIDRLEAHLVEVHRLGRRLSAGAGPSGR